MIANVKAFGVAQRKHDSAEDLSGWNDDDRSPSQIAEDESNELERKIEAEKDAKEFRYGNLI